MDTSYFSELRIAVNHIVEHDFYNCIEVLYPFGRGWGWRYNGIRVWIWLRNRISRASYRWSTQQVCRSILLATYTYPFWHIAHSASAMNYCNFFHVHFLLLEPYFLSCYHGSFGISCQPFSFLYVSTWVRWRMCYVQNVVVCMTMMKLRMVDY